MGTNTPAISIACFAIAAFLGAVGQFLYKSGAAAATGGWVSYLANARLLGGVVCYVAVMVLFVAAFKQGGSLTVLYPIYASTFIWAALIAWRVDGTPITAINGLGMGLIIAGMLFLGWRS
jgi:multidrug transporter EmrE-like cation transporter